ncbi:hypothetical protein D0T53_04515 [Dysgonomonas sp. 216]|uniref:hypothetical protein n=1 Tax=Dysgonomonas sp. 216 TaxID=2302934 RepID=UPI0013D33978|nr:hypothetical protein [Dysgonomonas sp. 216]NDW18181.1 hypothetical protein [Dysgonomonas sp. 216]
MQNLTNIKKYLLLVVLILLPILTYASPASTNFLPIGDSYASSRNEDCGATVENIKPYRETVSLEKSELTSYTFGSTDIFICVILLGVYFAFQHKKSGSRNAGL